MDLRTYQDGALKTALPTSLTPAYLVPAFIAEVGECFGKVAKAVRDEWDEDDLNEHLIYEWGDCAWPIAVLMSLDGLHKSDHVKFYFKTRNEALQELLGFADCMPEDSKKSEWRTDLLHDVWSCIRDGSEVVTGKPWEEVAQANLDKLADRANRNKIGGSGDTR